MELRHIRYFLAVAEHLNFRRAAEQLHIVQPNLTQQIKKLEQEVDLLLFRRDSNGVALTPAGEAFLPRARRIMSEVDAAVVELRQFSSKRGGGRVAIGMMFTLGNGAIDMPELLQSYSQEHPDIDVMVHEGTGEELLRMLRIGKLNAAVLDLSIADNPEDLEYEVITSEPLIAIVSKDHPLATRGTVELSELAGERFVQLATGSPARLGMVVKACKSAGFLPNFALFPANVPMARSLVAANMGVYITHRWVAESNGPPISMLNLNNADLVNRIALVWKDRWNGDVASFLRFAWPALRFRGTGALKLRPPAVA